MKYRHLAYLALVAIALSAFVLPVSAQGQVGVVKLDVSRTTVYRGYQWVEVVAYIYTGEGVARPTLTRAVAILRAGLELTLPMALVELYVPTTITVDNVDYTIGYLAVARVHVPEAAYTGKGVLRIEIAGSAAGVGFTYTKDISLEIADHRPVLATKTETQAALERVRAVISVASALGVDVAGYVAELSTIESTVAGATERLEIYGEVDEALSLYRAALSSLASLEAKVISSLALRYGALEGRVSSLEASLDRTVESVEALSRDLAKAISDLGDRIEEVSGWAASATSTLAKQFEEYSKTVAERFETLADSVDSALKSLTESYTKSTKSALDDLAAKVKTLDENVARLSKSQEDLASRVSDISNTLQIGLIVVALMLLLSIVLVRFLK